MTQVTGPAGGHTALLAREECDRLEQQLRHAVAEFVDGPRHAVEEADRTLEEIATRFTDAVTRRRRTLRMSWQNADAPGGAADDTEQLRLALRDYRELAELLLHEGGDGAHDGGTAAGTGERMAPGPGRGMTDTTRGSEARLPATDAQREAMAKPQEESPTVAPTPRSTEHSDRTQRGDIA